MALPVPPLGQVSHPHRSSGPRDTLHLERRIKNTASTHALSATRVCPRSCVQPIMGCILIGYGQRGSGPASFVAFSSGTPVGLAHTSTSPRTTPPQVAAASAACGVQRKDGHWACRGPVARGSSSPRFRTECAVTSSLASQDFQLTGIDSSSPLSASPTVLPFSSVIRFSESS